MIPNHFAWVLSELDRTVITSVPPGGNWKNVPESVPSTRLAQIRDSYARGVGGRSTYYGRLHPDRPSYTINTLFNRPGNGCHIHYEQDRLLSQREAARLQSFPDSFEFLGSRSSVNRQIGNAFPPLIGYAIACELTRLFGKPGYTVDLFCGAGGLALGFSWAGWTAVGANDVSADALATFALNLKCPVVLGDARSPAVSSHLLDICSTRRLSPLVAVGGPPCQGFSTAGKPRALEDERNQFYADFSRLACEIKVDGYVFENVWGITSLGGGQFFARVTEALAAIAPQVGHVDVRAESFGVPQRRRRLILIGARGQRGSVTLPTRLIDREPVSVRQALDDLPRIEPGEDGSRLGYDSAASTKFQQFARGALEPPAYHDWWFDE